MGTGKKRKWSLRVYFMVQTLICASLMIAEGVASLYGESREMSLVKAVINLGMVVFLAVRSRVEPLDEMARRNLGKAAYGTFLFVLIALFLIWIFLDFGHRTTVLNAAGLFFAMAAVVLSLGVQFVLFDRSDKA